MKAAIKPCINVLLVYEETLLREGLGMLLQNEPSIHLVGSINYTNAPETAARKQPDVIVLDIDHYGEDTIGNLFLLLTGGARRRILVLTNSQKFETQRHALQIGAAGVFLKNQSSERLIKAIHCVHEGRIWADCSTTIKANDESSHSPLSGIIAPGDVGFSKLSHREQQVIRMVASGFATKHVAQKLHISEKTVSNHLSNIYRKLRINSRYELFLYLSKNDFLNGLLSSPATGCSGTGEVVTNA